MGKREISFRIQIRTRLRRLRQRTKNEDENSWEARKEGRTKFSFPSPVFPTSSSAETYIPLFISLKIRELALLLPIRSVQEWMPKAPFPAFTSFRLHCTQGRKARGREGSGGWLGWPRKWNGSTAQGDERESIFLLRGRKTTLYNKSRRDICQKDIFWMPLRCRLSPSRWTLFMQEVGCLFTPSPQPHTKELQVQYFSQLKETKLSS